MKETGISKNKKADGTGVTDKLYLVLRIAVLFAVVFMFIPGINPARISGMIGRNLSLFTSGISYSSLASEFGRAFRKGWVMKSTLRLDSVSALIICVGTAAVAAGGCLSLGNLKMKKLSNIFTAAGSAVMLSGLGGIALAYSQISQTEKPKKIEPIFSNGFYMILIVAVLILIVTLIAMAKQPKVEAGAKYEMETKYRLFLMLMPFLALAGVFCYLPLWGWRYAFFDYKVGDTLSMDNFVGFKWFTQLFKNPATVRDIIRVLKNTLAMSGLGILTSWLPMAFAIFLCEIKNMKFRRVVQTLTTVPNFISWVLVYALAIAIFSTDGFINEFAKSIGLLAKNADGHNFLMGDHFTWVKMWAWGTWKGVGWSAIIYISGIAGIDQQLYEAATVDGAGRFQKMWHITVPGLLPTFFVLLLMAVAAVLSNGLDQYLVFCTPQNKNHIEVLDLYVYNLGLGSGGSIPLSTVVGMFKSVISVILLFGANSLSKALRGESIV